MASDEKLGSDFVSIVVADSTASTPNSWPMLCAAIAAFRS